MAREDPGSMRGVSLGVAATVLGIAMAMGAAHVSAQGQSPLRVKKINQFITSPAVSVGPGEVFTFRVTCQGTHNNTPCRTKVRLIDPNGAVVKQFDVQIAAGRTQEFSVEPGLGQPRTSLWVSAEIEWRALREKGKNAGEDPQEVKALSDCGCDPETGKKDDCNSQPTVIETTDRETGKPITLNIITKCIRAIEKPRG